MNHLINMKSVKILVAFFALYMENLMMYISRRRKRNCKFTRKIPGGYLCLEAWVGGGGRRPIFGNFTMKIYKNFEIPDPTPLLYLCVKRVFLLPVLLFKFCKNLPYLIKNHKKLFSPTHINTQLIHR